MFSFRHVWPLAANITSLEMNTFTFCACTALGVHKVRQAASGTCSETSFRYNKQSETLTGTTDRSGSSLSPCRWGSLGPFTITDLTAGKNPECWQWKLSLELLVLQADRRWTSVEWCTLKNWKLSTKVKYSLKGQFTQIATTKKVIFCHLPQVVFSWYIWSYLPLISYSSCLWNVAMLAA